eukprot:2662457-Amphidinium_carterae.1
METQTSKTQLYAARSDETSESWSFFKMANARSTSPWHEDCTRHLCSNGKECAWEDGSGLPLPNTISASSTDQRH